MQVSNSFRFVWQNSSFFFFFGSAFFQEGILWTSASTTEQVHLYILLKEGSTDSRKDKSTLLNGRVGIDLTCDVRLQHALEGVGADRQEVL